MARRRGRPSSLPLTTARCAGEGFFKWLEAQAKASADPAERELLLKVTAKLSNPLLRQPAPFEF
jgi:hypothetical protein